MSFHRYSIVLVTGIVLTAATALAAPPPGVSVGVGTRTGIGAPPIGAPPVHVPPLTMPPVNVPKPQTNAPPTNTTHAGVNTNMSTSVAAGNVMHGTLTSVSGTTVTIQLSNGTTQTYTVTSQTAARLQTFLKKNIAFRVQNGALAFVGAGTPPLHGTLTSLTGTTAQIKLANGTTQSYTLTAQQAAWLRAHVGKAVAFWANANGTIELNQRSHRSSTAAHHPARRHTH